MSARTDCIDEELGLWSIVRTKSNGWNLRTTVLRLADERLAVLSPTRGLEDEVAALGTPSYLVAPNHFHHLGIENYLTRWPSAKPLTSAGALPRLTKKYESLTFESLDLLRERLPSGTQLLEPEGLKNGEILLRAQTSAGIAWAVSDAFFNMAEHPSGMMGLVIRATGTSKGLRIGRTFTTLAIQSKPTYAAWLRAQLGADQPTILLPGHGEVIRDQSLPTRLDTLIRERLGG